MDSALIQGPAQSTTSVSIASRPLPGRRLHQCCEVESLSGALVTHRVCRRQPRRSRPVLQLGARGGGGCVPRPSHSAASHVHPPFAQRRSLRFTLCVAARPGRRLTLAVVVVLFQRTSLCRLLCSFLLADYAVPYLPTTWDVYFA